MLYSFDISDLCPLQTSALYLQIRWKRIRVYAIETACLPNSTYAYLQTT